jgi:beta-glucosidase
VGLFENPYLDEKRSKAIVGCPENMAAGYEAQLKSIVMLKNKSALPIKKGAAVYIPKYEKPVGGGWFSPVERLEEGCSVDPAEVAKFYTVTDDPQKADFALLYISSPQAMLKYKVDRREPGGSEYYPFSLQYAPYTAEYAREVSIAGGDPFETGKNRSYKGKTVHVLNEGEEKLVQDTKRLMGDKPVVVVLKMDKPTILSGIEPWADAILVQFKVKTQAVMDVISGAYEPSGLLPAQMPANMKTVEEHCEDVPFDKQCLTDSEGNTYDFGFGLNWSGVIRDKRTEKYIREK